MTPHQNYKCLPNKSPHKEDKKDVTDREKIFANYMSDKRPVSGAVAVLMPVILALLEAKIRRLMFKASLCKKFLRPNLNQQLSVVVSICRPSYACHPPIK
jgi:hypothetical protein